MIVPARLPRNLLFRRWIGAQGLAFGLQLGARECRLFCVGVQLGLQRLAWCLDGGPAPGAGQGGKKRPGCGGPGLGVGVLVGSGFALRFGDGGAGHFPCVPAFVAGIDPPLAMRGQEQIARPKRLQQFGGGGDQAGVGSNLGQMAFGNVRACPGCGGFEVFPVILPGFNYQRPAVCGNDCVPALSQTPRSRSVLRLQWLVS